MTKKRENSFEIVCFHQTSSSALQQLLRPPLSVYKLETAKLPENEKKNFFSLSRKISWKRTLMLLLSVSIIVKRSMPNPQPPVGGRPYSRAVQKFSSIS